MKPLTIGIVAAGIAVCVLVFIALDEAIRIPPRVLTETRMWVVKRRILRDARSHNQLPHALSELPKMEGYDNHIWDEWGRVLIYEVLPSGDIRLTSLGRDGKVGGSGKDQDMVTTFPSHDAQGRWSDEMVGWSRTPN